MCGIVGTVRFGDAQASPEDFNRAVQSLERRGPDSFGIWSDDRVQLGHRRLAIVDLSATGAQPMESADGRYVITFNGEIYNHLALRIELNPPGGWRGSSDTETLLEAFRVWGPDCLGRLDGMFSFAVWDRVAKTLHVARDRMGEKPLFYLHDGQGFAFASRPTALKHLRGGSLGPLCNDALAAYVDLGYVPSPDSIWRGVRKLPAAHYLVLTGRTTRLVRYWDFRHIRPERDWLTRSEDDLVDELDGLVRNAVRARLMSDVPLGAFLSGGTDSSLILATMKQVSSARPIAYTIGFHERSFDESAAASRIAGHIGVEHRLERMSVSGLLKLLPSCVEAFDAPIADTSCFPTRAVARLARAGVKVALTGDAGDELFGGYHYYSLAERMARLQRMPRTVRSNLASLLAMLPAHRAKLLAEAMRRGTNVRLFHFVRSMRKDFPSILTDDALANSTPSSFHFEQSAATFALDLCPADVGMRLDAAFTLADGYLTKVDVATMASSLESRCVLTDHHIVEWAMRLPVKYKLRGSQTKYLLKKLLCRYLPGDLVYQPKRGFGMPVAAWLRGPLKSWAEQILNEKSLFDGTPISQESLRALFDLHNRGVRDAHPLLWSALMLLCFIAHHERGMALPPVSDELLAA